PSWREGRGDGYGRRRRPLLSADPLQAPAAPGGCALPFPRLIAHLMRAGRPTARQRRRQLLQVIMLEATGDRR
ncbi:hypothetical protein, partial [Pseudomonas chlororaphis]